MSKVSALISVSDKSGLAEFARTLADCGMELLSTGGTARALREAGLTVTDVSDVTGFPEILDGRVKTLHPAIHGGLLARRDVPEHMKVVEEHGFRTIDFVIVNLYPFVQAASKPGNPLEAVVEQIDIGGPSMLRSAAKNFASVTVVTDPADYQRVAAQLKESGKTQPELRAELAAKVFAHTSAYDAAIANYLYEKAVSVPEEEASPCPRILTLSMPMAQTMRYGENPHQSAAFYRDTACTETSIANSKQLHGKALSYNNVLDAEGALEMVRDFASLAPCAAVIIKHSNPCGIAIGGAPAEAYERARSCDPDSAFGGIVALSQEADAAVAEAINATFNEIVIAPSFSEEAQSILTKKKNLRLLATGAFTPKAKSMIARGIVGGALLMDRDIGTSPRDEWKVVSDTKPSAEDLDGLAFAWLCVKWVKSNAIVYTNHTQTLGIGAGQMSRIDASRIGEMKANFPLKGSFLASDAFFPFRDNVDNAAKIGVKAIIQPGGSVRDEESIAAANEHGIAMVFTGRRHFRH